MVNPLRISYENDCNGAILSASSSFGSLPVAHLKDFDIQKIWRATESPAWIIADIGRVLTLDEVSIINCNWGLSDTARVRASITDPTVVSSLTYDSGDFPAAVDPLWGKFIHFLPSSVSYQYLRVDITTAETYPEAGRLQSGQVWDPTRNMEYGWEKLSRDFSTKTRSLGGNEFVDVKPRQRGFRFTIPGLTEDEVQTHVDTLNRVRGIGIDILVCRDVNSSNLGRDTIWGLMEDTVRQRQTHLNSYEIELEVWDRN